MPFSQKFPTWPFPLSLLPMLPFPLLLLPLLLFPLLLLPKLPVPWLKFPILPVPVLPCPMLPLGNRHAVVVHGMLGVFVVLDGLAWFEANCGLVLAFVE